MIEKIDKEKISSYIVEMPTSLENITNKINEIIDYLNDTSKTTKRTYMSTNTGAIIDD